MIRLAYAPHRSGERSVDFHQSVVRFGSGRDCELCLSGLRERAVAAHHGEFVLQEGTYFVVAKDERLGVWVNGRRVRKLALRGGERIRLGSAEGPEIRVVQVTAEGFVADDEEDDRTQQVTPEQMRQLHQEAAALLARKPSAGAAVPARRSSRESAAPPVRKPSPVEAPSRPARRRTSGERKAQARPKAGQTGQEPVLIRVPTKPQHASRPPERVGTLGRALKLLRKPHKEVQQWLHRAQKEIEDARSSYAGQPSGQTMVIMAKALSGLRQSSEGRAQQSRRKLVYLLAISLGVVLSLTGVVWLQHQRINHLIHEKVAIDEQIQSIFEAMATETDEAKLVQLEARLQALMGKASEKVSQVSQSSAKKARALTEPADELERDIRKILKSFNAETYAIPPIFKKTLQRMLAEMKDNPGMRSTYQRKLKYWPQIQRALGRKQLPEELGYICYTESRFDPTVQNAKSKASGMWQLMVETARECGITVNSKLDERFDAGRSSDAAACYLSKLLIEFGEESFMLVLASYNRGENGVRRALHKLAREPGGYKKRDFWHLYRLKLLPDETREYVPRVIAAAIMFGNPERYGLVKKESE